MNNRKKAPATDNRLKNLWENRQDELCSMYHQSEEYWVNQDTEIKLRAYHQYDFGGYHAKWLDELWERHKDISILDPDGDPLGWFISWWIVPEQEGLYLDSTSYLIDVNDGVHDREEGERVTKLVFERDRSIAKKHKRSRRLTSAYFTVLVTVLRRLLRLFVMQNADLMSNAPTFKRLFFMEREATLGILEYLKEEMKRRAESASNPPNPTARKWR